LFSKKIEIKLDGVITFDFDNRKLISKEIYGYKFNTRFNEYLKAVITEDTKIKEIFITNNEKNEVYRKAEDELTGLLFSEDIECAKDANERLNALYNSFSYPDVSWANIINSVLEFLILEEIGGSLSKYNYHNEINKNWYKEYTRDDLDDSVLQNKVIDIITKDAYERDVLSYDHGYGIVCIMRGDFIYSPISLNLPLKSKIFRNKHNILTIDTKYYTIQILPCFPGVTKLVDRILMKEDDWHSAYEADIKLVVIKKGRIINDKKARYALKWLDELLQGIYKYVSFDTFEQEINLKGLIVLKRIVNDVLAQGRPVKKSLKKTTRRKRS
jgi:hypothetical protein